MAMTLTIATAREIAQAFATAQLCLIAKVLMACRCLGFGATLCAAESAGRCAWSTLSTSAACRSTLPCPRTGGPGRTAVESAAVPGSWTALGIAARGILQCIPPMMPVLAACRQKLTAPTSVTVVESLTVAASAAAMMSCASTARVYGTVTLQWIIAVCATVTV